MPLSQLAQTNGTIDTFYKYKNRVLPVKQQCQISSAICTPSQLCKPGFSVVKRLQGMFCCPDPRMMGPVKQPCTKIGFQPPYVIYPNPQTHDIKTFDRERVRKRVRGGGAAHQNKVVEPENGGSPLLTYLLIGGAGYLGYRGFKKYKARKKVG